MGKPTCYSCIGATSNCLNGLRGWSHPYLKLSKNVPVNRLIIVMICIANLILEVAYFLPFQSLTCYTQYTADHMAPPSGSMEEILILSRREEPEIYREIDQNFISNYVFNARGWFPKFATGPNIIIGCSSKSMWVIKLSFWQNDPLTRESFWENNSLVTHMLLELCLLWYSAQSTFFSGHTLFNRCWQDFS